MTKDEEYLMIYSDQLETIIFALTDTKTASGLMQRAKEASDKLCFKGYIKEMIEQCESK